ncbi:MAG: dockerin type I repeat-containing protein [Chloroflexi bacterium]|nr:dockerin type I repeat-containing protein [Chloroflexota bacterium]
MSRILVALLVPVAAAVALLTLVAIGPNLGGEEASAAEGGPEMALSVTDPEGVCSEGVCDIPVGAPFTLAVEIVEGPAEGYILAQSFIDFGPVLRYKPSQDAVDEFVWPDCRAETRVREPLTERTYTHGCLTGLIPPLPSSFYTGNLIELSMTCSEADTTSEVRLLPNNDPLALTNGALFTTGDPLKVVPKVTGLTVHCQTEGEHITPVPISTPQLTWTVEVEPENPRVGDSVKLTLFAEGQGARPKYMLVLDSDESEPALRLLSSGGIFVNQLGVPVSYALDAVAVGETTLQLSVNYEVVNCPSTGGEGCVFFFDTEQGPEIVVEVVTPPRPIGDANCDGVVTSADATIILQLVAALVDGVECEELADVNGDGTLDAIDALLTLQFVVGLINLPIESNLTGCLDRSLSG